MSDLALRDRGEPELLARRASDYLYRRVDGGWRRVGRAVVTCASVLRLVRGENLRLVRGENLRPVAL